MRECIFSPSELSHIIAKIFCEQLVKKRSTDKDTTIIWMSILCGILEISIISSMFIISMIGKKAGNEINVPSIIQLIQKRKCSRREQCQIEEHDEAFYWTEGFNFNKNMHHVYPAHVSWRVVNYLMNQFTKISQLIEERDKKCSTVSFYQAILSL